MGAVEVKGLVEPVPVWRLEGLRGDISGARHGSFVGRRAERRQFGALIEACLETGGGQTILARGEAGIGKTRLVEEFAALAAASGFACHKGLVLDFGVGKGQDAVRALVRSLLGLAGGGDKAARTAAADRAIEAGWLEADARVFLNDLLDLPQPLELRALYDAMDYTLRNEGKRKALGELLAAASAARPVLLLVEDVQWADAPVLADLAYLARALFEYRAVLVMTSRVDGDPLDAAWRATARGVELTTIDLPPLREKEATEMAAAFVDTQSEFAAACVARAEGNPMFLEQLLRSAEEATAGTVPGSVQSSVLARMDMLDDRDRRALRAAAVIGQRFSLELLRHLLGDGGFSCTSLIEHYLVQPEGAEYLFGHSLIRDGAYASLLKSNRHELHERAAMWFKDRDPILHAEHLARAESLLAPGAYLEAAQGQAGDFHFETAQGLCADGLALEPEPQTRCALLCLQGDVLRYLGENETSIESFRGALDCGTSDRDRCRAWLGVAGGMRVLDRYDEALDALAQAEKATDADPADVARIHFDRGNIFFPTGNIEGCLEEHEAARKYSRAAGSAEGEARALGGLGDAYYQRGRMITANKHFDDCIKLCRKHGFVRIEVANLHMRGYTRFYNIDLAGGWEDCRTAAAMAQRIGLNRAEIVARMGGCMLLHAGDPKAAQEELHRGLALTRRIGARRFEAWFLAFLAKAAFVEGRGDEAVTLVTEAVAISRETGLTFVGPMCLGILALVTEDPTVRGDALAEAEKALAEECVSHNYLFFYSDAIAVCIRIGELSAVLRYADALEEYFRAEPLRWSDYYVRWGRALAAFGAGGKNEENLGELRRLRQQAGELRLAAALPVLDAALGESPARAPLGVAD
ncbi:MAG: AAA family ATPase [Proteobacteria bacterium]|nr:AAA family ATPase [Pseudomonadota bacterium]